MKYEIPFWIGQEREALIILDGDQKRELPDPKILNESQIAALPTVLNQLGLKPIHIGSDPVAAKKYVEWLRDRVIYLDAICPEALILEKEGYSNALELTNEQAKTELSKYLEENGMLSTAEFINAYPRVLWKKGEEPHTAVKNIANHLKTYLSG